MTASKPAADASARPLSPALDKTFKIGLVLKGLDGVLEVIGGILLLFLSPQAIQHIARDLQHPVEALEHQADLECLVQRGGQRLGRVLGRRPCGSCMA